MDGPMTISAIRNYQRANNLTVTGRLDSQTRSQLGISQSGEANRQATASSSSSSVITPSMATVKAAQQMLQQQGLYKGNVDGAFSPETRSAIREYQQNSGLTVNGQLDQQTLSSLGVSK